jgi:Putative peptidoglycan binding domain
LNAQNASPGGSPDVSKKPKAVRVAPKHVRIAPQPAPNVQAPAVNPPPRKQASVISFSDALARSQRVRHTRDWWKRHFTTIVFVGGGYYYFDSGYWFPAWGYDSSYESYDYDGPIFTYGNLLPDQVIVNVQRALQQLGYFAGTVSGSLSPATRRAISAFQQDNGLEINGVVDGPTVYALGLI